MLPVFFSRAFKKCGSWPVFQPPQSRCRAKGSRILLSKQEGSTRLSSSPGTTAETFSALGLVASSEQGTFLTQKRTQPSLQAMGGWSPFPEAAMAFGQSFAAFCKDKRMLQRQPLSSAVSPKFSTVSGQVRSREN